MERGGRIPPRLPLGVVLGVLLLGPLAGRYADTLLALTGEAFLQFDELRARLLGGLLKRDQGIERIICHVVES